MPTLESADGDVAEREGRSPGEHSAGNCQPSLGDRGRFIDQLIRDGAEKDP
jgi:hypothetical protein